MGLTHFPTYREEIPFWGEHAGDSLREFPPCAAIPAVVPSSLEPPTRGDRISAGFIVNHGEASDEQLLAAARCGDGQAFAELSGRCAAGIRQKAFRILGTNEDAEDAVQDALIQAYTHIGEFRGISKFSTWLTRIVINSALTQLRRRRSHSEVSFHQRGEGDSTSEVRDFPDPSPDPAQSYEKLETASRLRDMIERLSPSYRSILNLYYGQERSLQESAEILGITVSAAKTRLRRARLSVSCNLRTKRRPLAYARA